MTFISDSDTVSAERLLQIISQLQIGNKLVLITNSSGQVLAANPEATDFFDLTSDAAGEIWLYEYLPELEQLIASGLNNLQGRKLTFNGKPDTVLTFQG